MALDLTAEIIAELSGKPVEDKRKALTDLHLKGYSIEPYLEEMLRSSDGTHPQQRNDGFRHTTYAYDRLVLYTLSDGKTTFIYSEITTSEHETPVRSYQPWP